LWIEDEFEEASKNLEKAVSLLDVAMENAIRDKDNALKTIYLAEWLTITGTSMITGLTIWALMIKKTEYRDITTTSYRDKEGPL
jgi:hypothetical protein